MGRNNSSIAHQFHEKMEDINQIGESRHQAKNEERAKNKAEGITAPVIIQGIHSFNTYKAYKQTLGEFTSWMTSNNIKYKTIGDIPRSTYKTYLLERQDRGITAASLSKDMAAFNKIMDLGLTKKEIGLKARSYKDITRSRVARSHDTRYNPENYSAPILFARASGCRRMSVLIVEKKSFKMEDGLPVSVHLKEKGGLNRDAFILPEYRKALASVLASSPEKGPIFSDYSKLIDNHAFRGEYARELYAYYLAQNPGAKKDYRGLYNAKLLEMVSVNLGHRRPTIVFYNYMR